LANLSSEVNYSGSPKVAIGLRWRYVFGTAVLAVGVLAALWSGMRTSRESETPTPVVKLNSGSGTAAGSMNTPTGNRRFVAPQVSEFRSRSTARHLPRQSATTREPRGGQFPSPRPLSEQEQLLVTCVRSHRDEAIFMARAQAEFHQQQEQEMDSLSSEQ